jgi:hypothetical protein
MHQEIEKISAFPLTSWPIVVISTTEALLAAQRPGLMVARFTSDRTRHIFEEIM